MPLKMVESFKQSWGLKFEDYKNCTGSLGHNFVADWFVVIIISDKSLTGTLLYILVVIKSWVRVNLIFPSQGIVNSYLYKTP